MDWKIGAVVAVVVVIMATAFFGSGFSLPSFDASGVSGFFTAVSGSGPKNVTVDAVLDLVDFKVDTAAYSIEAELINPSSRMTVGTSLVDLSTRPTVKIEIKGWKGKIGVDDSLSLDGTAEEITVDGIKLSPVDKESKLSFSGLSFEDLKVRDVSLPQFSFPKASGYVYINGGKTTVRLDNEPFDLASFKGDITVDSSVRLSGVSSIVSSAGENTVSVK